MDMKSVESFLKELEGLSDEKLFSVSDKLSSVLSRAAKLAEEKAAADKRLEQVYPKCSCGNPIQFFGYFNLEITSCKPAIFHSNVKDENGEVKRILTEGIEVSGDWDSDSNFPEGICPGRDKDKYFSIGMCGDRKCGGFTSFSGVGSNYLDNLPEGVIRIHYA
jgi:hypothetical protein